MVFGVGSDKDTATARTLSAGQTLIHEDSDTAWGEDYWVQRLNGTTGAAGAAVSISDSAPTSNDQWNLAAVEVRPASAGGASTATTQYAYSGASTGAWAELSSTGTVQQQEIALPGGATYSARPSASGWSYGNLHGDVTLLADNSGIRGSSSVYDPFGDSVDPLTGSLGTTQADDGVPDDDPVAEADRGWAGGAGKVTEHQGDISSIEMGARIYLPLLGRFASVDPLPGSNSNCYSYPNDPLNNSDLSGMRPLYDTGNGAYAPDRNPASAPVLTKRSSGSVIGPNPGYAASGRPSPGPSLLHTMSTPEAKNAAVQMSTWSTGVGTVGFGIDAAGFPEVGVFVDAVSWIMAAAAAGMVCQIKADANCQMAIVLAVMGPIGGAAGKGIDVMAPKSLSSVARAVYGNGAFWFLDGAITVHDLAEH